MIRKALTAILLAGLLLTALGVAAQGAEKRVALVIGNAKYPQTPLTNPVNDAQDIAKALKDCGFDVTLRTDCTKAQMDEAIQELGRKVKGGGIALFYYAGHGFQTSDNKNYLMPVDAAWSGESEAKLRCYEAELVMAILEDAQARMNLIILDCCRDNPFTRSFRSSSAGLAAMTPPTDSVLVFSAAPGQRALDGQDRNSPFAKSLLRHVSSPGVELEELLMRVSAEVKNSALPHKQEPWRQTNRTSSFYFIPGSGASAAPSLVGHLQVAVNAPASMPSISGAWGAGSRAGETRTLDLGGGVALEMVWIPPGEFMMGSPSSEEERISGETQHCVTLTRGFWMGKYEVTQAQWERVMGNNPSHFKGDKNLPVEQVSWGDCQEFIQKLSEQISSGGFRLPTEAEWEYACRAGTTTPFHFGDTISTTQANYDGNSIYGSGRKGVYRQKTTPAGTFPANAWGLHDMHGNVREWCHDWYGSYHGGSSGFFRVYRGGSWGDGPGGCRSAGRSGSAPGSHYRNLGFRLALPAVQ